MTGVGISCSHGAMMRLGGKWVAAVLLSALAAGCGGEVTGANGSSKGSGSSSAEGGAGPTSTGSQGGGGEGAGQATASVGTGDVVGSGGGGGGLTASGSGGTGNESATGAGGATCNAGLDEDHDGDGFTIAQGDCNDCDPSANPGAIEVITSSGAAVDNDCNGVVDDVPGPCDSALALDSTNPIDGLRAIGLCQQTTMTSRTWGVISAKWVLPDGTNPPSETNFDLGHGILDHFGANVHVQEGKKLLALSSGSARNPADPGYQDVSGFDKGYLTGSPMGFPKKSPACPGVVTGQPHDGVGLEAEIRVPTNATGFAFDFAFFTYEWPDYICTQYNDFFVTLLSPVPVGLIDGNIAFDAQGNPICVNSALIDVCGCAVPPCVASGKTYTCSQGSSFLLGTGFGADSSSGEPHASTGWLRTRAPATGGSTITLRWTVYDSTDGNLDSTTIIDGWQWITDPNAPVTVQTQALANPL